MHGPQHRQQRIRPHGQRDVPIPSRPMPSCILIQADFALGLCKAPFDAPATARPLHDGVQGGRLGGKHTVRRALRGGGRLRRTTSHRRQEGCSGAARGSHVQSYHRGPLVPSPARNRYRWCVQLLPPQCVWNHDSIRSTTVVLVGCNPLFSQSFHLSMGCLASQAPAPESTDAGSRAGDVRLEVSAPPVPRLVCRPL